MIYQTTTKKVKTSDGKAGYITRALPDLDLQQFYKDAEYNGYTIDKEELEYQLVRLPYKVQTSAVNILTGFATKDGSIASLNTVSKSLLVNIFSRDCEVITLDKTGNFKRVPANVPALEYDVISRQYKGIRLEKSSTNFIPKSHGNSINGWRLEQGDEVFGDIILKPINTGEISTINTFTTTNFISYFAILKIGAGIPPNPNLVRLLMNETEVPYTTEFVGFGKYKIVFSTTIAAAIKIELKILDSLKDYEVRIYGEQLENRIKSTSYIPTEGYPVTRMSDTIYISEVFGQNLDPLVPFQKNNLISMVNSTSDVYYLQYLASF